MSNYLIGLATPFAVAALVALVVVIRWFVIYRIQRLKGDAKPRQRAALAARLFASRRAYVWTTPRIAAAITLGASWPTQDRAEAVLLDEFAPLTEGVPDGSR